MEVENPTIDQKALLVLSTDKDLTVPQAEINGIRKFVLTCKTEGELMAPLNKKLNDFFTRHTNFIQKVLKKNKILFEEKRVKVHVIEQVLTGNFSLVYSKFFEESLLRERQINFDEKLKRCHDVPKKYWCKSYIPTSSYDWLNIIENLYKLNEFHSPFEKLDCIRAMIGNTIKLTTKENSKAGHKKCVTADDLAPILIYAIVTSSSPLLLINIKYINNFMTDDLMCGEEGYCLTTLLFAVEYIETVDLEELVKKDSDSVDDPSKHEEGEEEDAWVIVE